MQYIVSHLSKQMSHPMCCNLFKLVNYSKEIRFSRFYVQIHLPPQDVLEILFHQVFPRNKKDKTEISAIHFVNTINATDIKIGPKKYTIIIKSTCLVHSVK